MKPTVVTKAGIHPLLDVNHALYHIHTAGLFSFAILPHLETTSP